MIKSIATSALGIWIGLLNLRENAFDSVPEPFKGRKDRHVIEKIDLFHVELLRKRTDGQAAPP